jgi:hypothetical protein
MRTSEEIMNAIYIQSHDVLPFPNYFENAVNASIDEQNQEDKKIYLTFSEKLNAPLKGELAKKATLSLISQNIFLKKNKVSINKTPGEYLLARFQSRLVHSSKYFPEIEAFLENLSISCEAGDFDDIVLNKIDSYTQELYSHRDQAYVDLKNYFFQLENCSTPLDLLFRGLFYARAKQNIGKIKWIIFGFVITLLALILFVIL